MVSKAAPVCNAVTHVWYTHAPGAATCVAAHVCQPIHLVLPKVMRKQQNKALAGIV